MTASSNMEQSVHPSFRKLKVRCQMGMLRGAEPIILEFLHSLTQFVNDLHDSPDSQKFREHFQGLFKAQVEFLTDKGKCSLPMPMYNVIQQMQRLLADTHIGSTYAEVRQALKHWVEDFYNSSFESATNSIIEHTLGKIRSLQAANILTFGWSPIVESVLLELVKRPIANLNITVVDSDGTGKRLAKSLINRKVQCTYGTLNCLADELPHTNLVLLGANAVLSNGSLLAARGSAVVVYLARSYNIPVLVTVKSYQFIDKVHTIEKSATTTTLDTELLETITAEMISALVTDIRIIPPTSAPAVLKAKQLLTNED